jgi:hypothetical protein
MSTVPGTFAVESTPATLPRSQGRFGRLVASVRNAILRRIRGAALRVLDLETEFAILD